ncbi:MAG: hypothetical protein DRN49_06400 [Thaumarchaeota archaeon]|nr:MAG: hypothetical protein DRN49_06400 [Nitrososphaerota archaeon]
MRIDHGRLERILGVPVVKINPVKGTGIDELKRRIKEAESPKNQQHKIRRSHRSRSSECSIML